MEERRSQADGPAVDELLGQARAWAEQVGLTQRVQREPWLMFAGALAAGYVLGRVMDNDSARGVTGMLAGMGLPMAAPTGGGRPMRTSDFAHRHRSAGHAGGMNATGR